LKSRSGLESGIYDDIERDRRPRREQENREMCAHKDICEMKLTRELLHKKNKKINLVLQCFWIYQQNKLNK
jgi:hypothetical protein